jgi:hypothetical protein
MMMKVPSDVRCVEWLLDVRRGGLRVAGSARPSVFPDPLHQPGILCVKTWNFSALCHQWKCCFVVVFMLRGDPEGYELRETTDQPCYACLSGLSFYEGVREESISVYNS